jgi:hypothetical protein
VCLGWKKKAFWFSTAGHGGIGVFFELRQLKLKPEGCDNGARHA